MATWIYISQNNNSFEASKVAYLQRFPVFFNNARAITSVEIVLLVISLFCFKSVHAAKVMQISAMIGVVLSGVLMSWLIFSLM